MSDKNMCPICGEPSRSYMGNTRKDRLCGKHADLLKTGEIIVNENGLFLDAKSKKVLNKDYKSKEQNQECNDEKHDSIVVKCIGCGKETKNGNLFCYSCYQKYKNKELLVRITKCKEIKIEDEAYEGKYTCKDGHIVKSKSERAIDDYLFDRNIPHAYEKVLSIDANPEHDLHPDFFLPSYNGINEIYIEHFGLNPNNRDYTLSKKYKLDQYKKQKLTIICLNEKDQNDLAAALDRKLKFFKPGIINFDD